MPKFIICLTGKIPLTHGFKIHEFIWDEALQTYVFEGKSFTEHELNAKVDVAYKRYPTLVPHPRVRCIDATSAAIAETPIATITTAREITLDEAEAVMQREAPHRLKKKPGPIKEDATAAA